MHRSVDWNRNNLWHPRRDAKGEKGMRITKAMWIRTRKSAKIVWLALDENQKVLFALALWFSGWYAVYLFVGWILNLIVLGQ